MISQRHHLHGVMTMRSLIPKSPILGMVGMMVISACAAAAPIDVTRGGELPLHGRAAAGAGAAVQLHDVRASGGLLPLLEVFLKDPQGNRVSIGVLSFFNETAPDAKAGAVRVFSAQAALAALRGRAIAVELRPISGVDGKAPAIAPSARVSIAEAKWAQD